MRIFTIICLVLTLLELPILDSYGQRPPMRLHTANKSQKLNLVKADKILRQKNSVKQKKTEDFLFLTVNSIPNHSVGRFPNAGNPHSIQEQKQTYRIRLNPKPNKTTTEVGLRIDFGIGVNGIPFDPGAAEFWQGRPDLNWQYEALGGAVKLGLDENYAHVQPTGAYHYHGISKSFLQSIGFDQSKHSPLVGWAADGFPIYAINGYSIPRDDSSKVAALQSSYRIKSGKRPGGASGPSGKYDGTFVNDYSFINDFGDLDECNGRFCVTPEFPNGTYAYFLTEHWPTIPRKFRGTPDPSFQKTMGRPNSERPPRHGPPPRRRRNQ